MADAATEAAQSLLAEAEDATDAPQVSEEGEEQTPEVVDEFDMELPADLAAEIEATPDFESEPEPEASFEEEEEPDEYEDPAVAEVKSQLRKTQKQLAWEKEQRLKQSRKQWVDKDGKYFPLADVKGIADKAQSRREFARLAKEENDRIKALPGVKKLLAAKAGASGAAEQAEQAEAWGTPATGSGLVPSEAAEAQAQIDKARATKGFRGAVTEMLKTGKVSI